MPAIARKTYNMVVFWWSHFWAEFATASAIEKKPMLAQFPKPGHQQIWDDIRKSIQLANEDSRRNRGCALQPDQIDQAATLCYSALLCRELLTRQNADRRAELSEKIEGRRLMNRAWRVIKNFERSNWRETVRARESFKAKILRLAKEKKSIYAHAARKARNKMLKHSYRFLARERGPQDPRLRDLLSHLVLNPSSREPMSELRRYFYATSESPRRIFRRYPRLTSYRYPRVYYDLEIFNLVCYFRLACGFEAMPAYWLTNLIVHRHTTNLPRIYSVSARFRRFAHRFCPAVLSYLRRA